MFPNWISPVLTWKIHWISDMQVLDIWYASTMRQRQNSNKIHYTLVLFLVRGRHLIHYSPVLPFCSLEEDCIFSRIRSWNVGYWEYWFPISPVCEKRGILEISTPNVTPVCKKRGILGVLISNIPPVWKTWDIGSTDFQYPPCLENVEYLEYWFPISPLFIKKSGKLA